jgi:hypothetical protein
MPPLNTASVSPNSSESAGEIALRATGNGERLAAAGCRRPQTATQLQVNLGPSRIGLARALYAAAPFRSLLSASGEVPRIG